MYTGTMSLDEIEYGDGYGAGFTEPCEICGNEIDADDLDDSGICDDCHLNS